MATSRRGRDATDLEAALAKLKRVERRAREYAHLVMRAQGLIEERKVEIKKALQIAAADPEGVAGATFLRNLIKHIMGAESF